MVVCILILPKSPFSLVVLNFRSWQIIRGKSLLYLMQFEVCWKGITQFVSIGKTKKAAKNTNGILTASLLTSLIFYSIAEKKIKSNSFFKKNSV